MKKAKILAVFGILLAMGITACNKGNEGGDVQSQDTPATSQDGGDGGDSGSSHTHSYGDWHETKAPTCTEKGTEEQECACGDKKTRSVNALGHDWGEWTQKTAATCTQDGEEERVCKRDATHKETRPIKAEHDWDAEQTVPAGTDPADQVGYKLAECKKGDAYKATLTATDAKFYKGGIKNGTPTGYFKLNSKNDKAYWKFTVSLPANKLLQGRLYQRGAMDSFSSNTDKSYASTSTSGDNAPEYTKGNFDAVVNGKSVDKTEWIRIPFSEFLADGEDSSAMGDNYSPLCLVPIGDCYIVNGVNEITYERLGSYNLIIDQLVFIGTLVEHTHTAAAEYSSDDTQHWHACTAPGCPTGVADTKAPHEFGAVTVKTPATHTADGVGEKECSVCGKKVEVVIPSPGHTWGTAEDIAAGGEGQVAYKKAVCADDQAIQLTLDATAGTFLSSSNKSGTPSGFVKITDKNGKISWKFTTTLGENKLLQGRLYQRGSMDSFSSNTTKTYAHTSSSDGNAKDEVLGNFDVKVNGNSLDKTQWINVPFSELLANGEDSTSMGNNYSPICLAPIGDCVIANGLNEITYERLGSFNLVINELVFIGEEITHTHVAAAEYSYDETGHWHACTADNCPTQMADEKVAHTFDGDPVVVPATTEAAGSKTYTCSVCGATKVEAIPQLALHEWSLETIVANRTDSGWESTKSFGEGNGQGFKFNKAGSFTVSYTSPSAQTVMLQLKIAVKQSNNASTGFWKQSGAEKTRITFNDVAVTAPSTEPDFTGSTASTLNDGGIISFPEWYDIIELDLVEGENTIKVEFVAGSYSYYMCGAQLMK